MKAVTCAEQFGPEDTRLILAEALTAEGFIEVEPGLWRMDMVLLFQVWSQAHKKLIMVFKYCIIFVDIQRQKRVRK